MSIFDRECSSEKREESEGIEPAPQSSRYTTVIKDLKIIY